MTAGEAVVVIVRLGGTISIFETQGDGDRLQVRPKGILTPYLLEKFQSVKPEVLNLLRLLNRGHVETYAGDVLGFDGESTAQELVAEAEQLGAELYIRPQGDVGMRHGEHIPDTLLLRLARAHVRLLTALECRENVKTKEWKRAA